MEISALLSRDQDQFRVPFPPHPIPTSLLRNASIASYRSESPGVGCFRFFPRLPIEIRLKIWHHAISIPHIVEMEKIPCWQHESRNEISYFPDRWHYKIRNPPTLLSTCSESRKEALKAYHRSVPDKTTSPSENPPWIRFDYDILHLKTRRWTGDGKNVDHEWSEFDVRGWSLPEENVSGGRYSKKRECFQNIQALAINRELFFATTDREESVLRRVFPNLKLLIVLIDDDTDIQKLWKIRRQDFSTYESNDMDPIVLRWAFTSASTGPFTSISCNHGYQQYVERLLRHRFKMEEKIFKPYVAPYVMVMGCSLPTGLEIAECGRRPRDAKIESRRLLCAGITDEPCDGVQDAAD
ncbi:hypothetical protein G7Y89_g2389 [Cudoniella acicularis]|uniref:2EXR domain-containing protein n=1 Tax=Cudoniella acicularis TaxID=354080 RepID=A0A8H4RWD0_9HELO|nr:hypothetical protein G7Y89_g2389 [Cudoniella acicularis]